MDADGTADDPATAAQIAAALGGIARTQGVRILLAVESGSRAWGFPSRDSDWDVRFLFVRPLATYVAIDTLPETIALPLTDTLDVNGWDLRKALRLLAGSNAVIMEWLASPVIYRSDPAVHATLAALARETAHLPALAYHYDRLARHFWPPRDAGPVRLKALFYAVRPALALAWLRRHRTCPPMDLPALMAGLDLPAGLTAAIGALRAQKQMATEADTALPPPAVADFLSATLEVAAPRAADWDTSGATGAANRLLLDVLRA